MTRPDDFTPIIKVDGTLLSAQVLDKLTHVRVERGIRLIGRTTLRFYDLGFEIASSATFDLGKTVVVTVTGGGMLMTGTVTGTQIEQREGHAPELVVTADDAALKLTRGSKVTTYADMTYSEVVQKILSEVALTAQLTATSEQFPYLLQTGSDLQFIEDIADRIGYDWWVGGPDGRTLMFAPPTTAPSALTVSPSTGMSEFTVRATGLHPTEVTVTGWSPTTQATVTSSVKPVQAGPGTATITDATFKKHILATGPLSAARATSFKPGVTTAAEATALAASLSDHAASGSVSARGTIEASALAQPGAYIDIIEAGPASGTYRLTRVEHIYSPNGFVTKFVAGDRRPTGLADLLGPRPASAFHHEGLVTGTVTDTNDDAGYGRVKVMINGLTASDTSAWARMATYGAGQERGFVVIPEVGDEVLVGFEHGDTRRPVILGGLFGDKGKMADYGVEEKKTIGRRLVSRLGYRMEISDGSAPAQQHVRLSLDKGDAHMIRLGKDKVQVIVPESVPVEIKAGAKASIIIDDQGNITIKGQKVTIEAQQDVSITSAAAAVSVSAATGDLKLEGMKFALKGSAQGEVNGGGTLAVKGGMVQIN
jgi:uncharacterized protein involved in type VI secretion and phage assembly